MRPLRVAHYDIHGSNVLLDAQDRVWLLDWENAGVYPSYFETAVLSCRFDCPFSKALFERLDVEEAVKTKSSC